MVTKQDIVEALKRLQAIYGVPLAAKRDRAGFEDEWQGVLRHAERHELARAVDAWIASDAEHWPKPGQLMAQIRRGRTPESGMGGNEKAYRAWEARTWDAAVVRSPDGSEEVAFTRCPVCNAVPRTQPRVAVVHNAGRHRDAAIPAIGATDETEAFYGPMREAWEREAAESARRQAEAQTRRAEAKLELQRLLQRQLDAAERVMS